jgi:ATP-dependent DNA helicase RecQ
VHAAKGMEFRHVVITGGAWQPGRSLKDVEEERRLLYVGMTRAKETLALVAAEDALNPFLTELDAAGPRRRRAEGMHGVDRDVLSRRYHTLSLADLVLSYAGRFPPADTIHAALDALEPGAPLVFVPDRGGLVVETKAGLPVGRLSAAGTARWRPRLDRILEIRTHAVVIRKRSDEEDPHRRTNCLSESWGIPIPEVVWREAAD